MSGTYPYRHDRSWRYPDDIRDLHWDTAAAADARAALSSLASALQDLHRARDTRRRWADDAWEGRAKRSFDAENETVAARVRVAIDQLEADIEAIRRAADAIYEENLDRAWQRYQYDQAREEA